MLWPDAVTLDSICLYYGINNADQAAARWMHWSASEDSRAGELRVSVCFTIILLGEMCEKSLI